MAAALPSDMDAEEAASALAAFFAQAQQGRPRQQQLLGGEDDDEYGEELVEDEEADLGGEDEEDQEQQGQEAAPHGRGPRGGRRPAPQRGARGGGRYGASSSTAGERRERNRLAARKCRAKRANFMQDLQKTLLDLVRQNEQLKAQAAARQELLNREARLRSELQLLIAALWIRQGGGGGDRGGSARVAAAPVLNLGVCANDVIVALEAGTVTAASVMQALQAAVRGGPQPVPRIPQP